MKVKKISSKLIKPVTPTPLNLKNYKISFADKSQVPLNISVILYYESKPESNLVLEESLAQTLVQFYPLAGRYIHKQLLIDCSDQGVEFVEAEAPDVDLTSLIGIQHADDLRGLLAVEDFQIDESIAPPLLTVQATHLACSAMAVAITVSHRVFDMSSLSTFLAVWSSNTTSPAGVNIITPSFDLPSQLPCSDSDFIPESGENSGLNKNNIIVKKLALDGTTLQNLRSKIGKSVSSTRVATAVIARALILLDTAVHGGRIRCFRIIQPVNMRERTITAIPKHACGNFAFPSLSRCVGASEAEGMGIPELIDLIGESARRCIDELAEIVSVDRDGRDIIMDKSEKLLGAFKDPDTNLINFTDWSKFGYYEADFGWGKPVWTSIGLPCLDEHRIDKFVILMGNGEGNGIEAWLHLNEDNMRCFEQHYHEFIINDL